MDRGLAEVGDPQLSLRRPRGGDRLAGGGARGLGMLAGGRAVLGAVAQPLLRRAGVLGARGRAVRVLLRLLMLGPRTFGVELAEQGGALPIQDRELVSDAFLL